MARHGLAAGARALLSEKDRLSGSRIALLLAAARCAQRSAANLCRPALRSRSAQCPAQRLPRDTWADLNSTAPRVAPCSSIGASGLMRAEGCKWVFIGVFEFLILVYFFSKLIT